MAKSYKLITLGYLLFMIKKTAFWICALVSLYLLISCIAVIIEVIKNATSFGLGVLTGKILLFIIFVALSIWLKRKAYQKN